MRDGMNWESELEYLKEMDAKRKVTEPTKPTPEPRGGEHCAEHTSYTSLCHACKIANSLNEGAEPESVEGAPQVANCPVCGWHRDYGHAPTCSAEPGEPAARSAASDRDWVNLFQAIEEAVTCQQVPGGKACTTCVSVLRTQYEVIMGEDWERKDAILAALTPTQPQPSVFCRCTVSVKADDTTNCGTCGLPREDTGAHQVFSAAPPPKELARRMYRRYAEVNKQAQPMWQFAGQEIQAGFLAAAEVALAALSEGAQRGIQGKEE